MATKGSIPKKSQAAKEEYVWAIEGEEYISDDVYDSVEACLAAANKVSRDFSSDDTIVIYKAVAKAAITHKLELI